MKAQLLKVPSQPTDSFSVRKDMSPNINHRWHYHTELELIHIHTGSGMQFVGDSMLPFYPGDVVLVGSNLPHCWRFDRYGKSNKSIPYSTVVHFREDVWGDSFRELPEARQIRNVLERSKRGILLKGKDAKMIGSLMENIYQSKGLHRLMALMETLHFIDDVKEYRLLSSRGFENYALYMKDERIHRVYEYTLQHAHKRIELSKIASVTGMVPHSFCRYFKSRAGKTYTQFLTEIRIGQACKLLIEDRLSVKQICFASGFNNYSSFFEKFKQITGKTPLQYRRVLNK
jgi:AraC-like DNA-binding protein